MIPPTLLVAGAVIVLAAIAAVPIVGVVMERRQRMADFNRGECGMCGIDTDNEAARCPSCGWDPARLADPQVDRKYQAFRALGRAFDDYRQSDLAGDRADALRRVSGSSAANARQEAIEDAGRSLIDAQDAIEQALQAVPGLRDQVGSLHDPELAAARLRDLLRRDLMGRS